MNDLNRQDILFYNKNTKEAEFNYCVCMHHAYI